jgi:hypothetical protein
MLTPQLESRLRRGAEKRQVYEAFDAGRRHSIDGAEMSVETILCLPERDQEEGVDAGESRPHAIEVAIVGDLYGKCSLQIWCITGIAD